MKRTQKQNEGLRVLTSDPTVADFERGAPQTEVQLPVVFIETDSDETKSYLAGVTRLDSRSRKTSFGAVLLNVRMAVANGSLSVSGRKNDEGVDIVVLTKSDVDSALAAIEAHRAANPKPATKSDASDAIAYSEQNLEFLGKNNQGIDLSGAQAKLDEARARFIQLAFEDEKADYRPVVAAAKESYVTSNVTVITFRANEVSGMAQKADLVDKVQPIVDKALGLMSTGKYKEGRHLLEDAKKTLYTVKGRDFFHPRPQAEEGREQRGDRGRRQGFGSGNVRGTENVRFARRQR